MLSVLKRIGTGSHKMVVRALCVIGSRALIVEVGGFGLKAFGLGGVAGKDQGR